MRTLDPGLAAHLQGGVTTLCHCWKLVRRDGTVLGFTDHDRDLVFGGTTFAAASGLDAAEATAELGFAVGGGEVSGALAAASLTEDDLAGGLYDDATVEVWLVNWAGPDQRLLLDVGSIGEIRRSEHAFVAELRGLMHRFNEEQGRIFQRTCSADLGDGRCGIDLANPSFGADAVVTATDGRLGFSAALLAGFAEGWFTGGKLVWTSGANAGAGGEVKLHTRAAGGADIVLWLPVPRDIVPGDGFRVTAGCDKRFETCRAKFANGVNFRGFPHMPGNDFVVTYPVTGEAGFDGGSLFR